jgi:hypothetical protein
MNADQYNYTYFYSSFIFTSITSTLSNLAVEWITFLLGIVKVQGSNFGPEVGYLLRVFVSFLRESAERVPQIRPRQLPPFQLING